MGSMKSSEADQDGEQEMPESVSDVQGMCRGMKNIKEETC